MSLLQILCNLPNKLGVPQSS